MNEGNLKPWQKGQSGNPNGQPPKTVSAILRELGESTVIDFSLKVLQPDGEVKTIRVNVGTGDDREEKKTLNYVIAARMIENAVHGDLNATKELLNRTEGSTPQTVNTSNVNKDVSNKLNFSKLNEEELEEYISHQKRMEEMERKIEENE